ncbi:MAG: ribonucleotide-diphosphate reductase subunit beta [Nitrososphaerota archaeon]|nr:ribonucleotide-diphosphate reductase subunit beta [Nitrososphaerota archaeon]
MRFYLVASELGLILLDERKRPISASQFHDRAKDYLEATSGAVSDSQLSWLKEKVALDSTLIAESQITLGLHTVFPSVQSISDEDQREIRRDLIGIIVASGLAISDVEAEEALRKVSIEISDLRIKELSSNPDLQAMESVQALDEVDKTANIISSRLREWYGLHFPELVSMVDDNISLAKLIINFKSRSNYEAGLLEQMGYSKAKSKAIETSAKSSRGADLRDEDLSRIIQLAEEAQHLFSLRDKLASHVEKTMRQVAPNLTEIAGATIGARLIARSGGLKRLAVLPASTIQILGAEKALYRALKSGARPPKHGILFQHASVHSAPKWQRGKVARSVAGKIAIAARIDIFRGTKDENILRTLETRLDEIKDKYKEAPKEEKQFSPRPRFDRGRERGRRDERFKKYGRGEKPPRKHGHDRR